MRVAFWIVEKALEPYIAKDVIMSAQTYIS
jgi:hypothetical protein